MEIVYFGLLPTFTSKGLGGWALSEAAKRGWAMGAKRVWVHTCDLDHPGALANYIARGFRQFKVEVNEEELPVQPLGPWPGAAKMATGPSNTPFVAGLRGRSFGAGNEGNETTKQRNVAAMPSRCKAIAANPFETIICD